jgi:hypothetical protein
MSWAESEKLNEWILRAYENGRREEQERIIQLMHESDSACVEWAVALIKGEPTDCECDPCGDETCSCQGKRCDFCKGKD